MGGLGSCLAVNCCDQTQACVADPLCMEVFGNITRVFMDANFVEKNRKGSSDFNFLTLLRSKVHPDALANTALTLSLVCGHTHCLDTAFAVIQSCPEAGYYFAAVNSSGIATNETDRCVPCDNVVCAKPNEHRTGVCSGARNDFRCKTKCVCSGVGQRLNAVNPGLQGDGSDCSSFSKMQNAFFCYVDENADCADIKESAVYQHTFVSYDVCQTTTTRTTTTVPITTATPLVKLTTPPMPQTVMQQAKDVPDAENESNTFPVVLVLAGAGALVVVAIVAGVVCCYCGRCCCYRKSEAGDIDGKHASVLMDGSNFVTNPNAITTNDEFQMFASTIHESILDDPTAKSSYSTDGTSYLTVGGATPTGVATLNRTVATQAARAPRTPYPAHADGCQWPTVMSAEGDDGYLLPASLKKFAYTLEPSSVDVTTCSCGKMCSCNVAKRLGKGAYGVVFKGLFKRPAGATKSTYAYIDPEDARERWPAAVKMLPQDTQPETRDIQDFCDEAELLRRVQSSGSHKNIITLFGYVDTYSLLFIYFSTLRAIDLCPCNAKSWREIGIARKSLSNRACDWHLCCCVDMSSRAIQKTL